MSKYLTIIKIAVALALFVGAWAYGNHVGKTTERGQWLEREVEYQNAINEQAAAFQAEMFRLRSEGRQRVLSTQRELAEQRHAAELRIAEILKGDRYADCLSLPAGDDLIHALWLQ